MLHIMCQHTVCMNREVIVEISGRLSKAARVLVNWRSLDLSERSGVPHDTIRAFESGRTRQLSTLNEKAVVDAFEAAGVQFIPENGGGVGVRFRDRSE